MADRLDERYLLAEYCPGPIYWGWWLYLRQSNGAGHREMLEFGATGWLQDEHQRHGARELCVELKLEPPPDGRHSQDFAEWFARTAPNGLRVEVGDYGKLKLLARCSSRPKQRRGCIRTIRGAAMVGRAKGAA